MGFGISENVTAAMAFLEGLLSFFSPCVLPLIPVYLSFLAGGNAEKDENGNLVYRRSKVLVNSFFFILGIALTFFILALGVKGIGLLFSRNRTLFTLIGGIIVVIAGVWQLYAASKGKGGQREYRFHLNTDKGRGVVFSFLLGFTFSFSWTPCIGPVLSSVLIASSVSARGTLLLLSYSIGFIIPFLVLAFFSTFFIRFLRSHMDVVKYTARAGAILMVILGLSMVFSTLPKKGEALEETTVIEEAIPETMDIEETSSPETEDTLVEDEAASYSEGEISSSEESLSSLMEDEIPPREEETLPREEEIVSIEEEMVPTEEDAAPREEDVAPKDGEGESLGEERAEAGQQEKNDREEESSSDIDILSNMYMDQYGKMHKLSSYKGKVIFLNFWATWCGPCRSEMKDIEKLYQKYKGSDVMVLAVASPGIGNEGSTKDVKSFLSENGYTYPVLMDTKGELSRIFGVSALPTTFMFSSDGNLFGYITGAISYETMENIISSTVEGR